MGLLRRKLSIGSYLTLSSRFTRFYSLMVMCVRLAKTAAEPRFHFHTDGFENKDTAYK